MLLWPILVAIISSLRVPEGFIGKVGDYWIPVGPFSILIFKWKSKEEKEDDNEREQILGQQEIKDVESKFGYI